MRRGGCSPTWWSLAVVADGADAISGISALGNRKDLFGPVAAMPTSWRVVLDRMDRIDGVHRPLIRQARAEARSRAWAAGAGLGLDSELCLDFDATVTIAASEKEKRRGDLEEDIRVPPVVMFPGRPDIADGEALAGLLRKGNAGSNTAADYIDLLDVALARAARTGTSAAR